MNVFIKKTVDVKLDDFVHRASNTVTVILSTQRQVQHNIIL